MATMNISGMILVEDPSYRYKMPRILAKVEGRGNGIKTVLVNVTDLGTSLNREAPEITKFFGCEIGSQTSFSADTDRAIVNGAHTAQDLQTHLCRYIENFVLCENCRLPETHYKIKAGAISQKCLACGHKSAVDMTHKLTTFILAQHKRAREIATKAEKGGDKKKKDKKETAAEEKATPVVEMTDAQATAAKADKKAKKDKLKEAAGEGKKKSRKTASGDDMDEEASDSPEGEETDSKAAGKLTSSFNLFDVLLLLSPSSIMMKAPILFVHRLFLDLNPPRSTCARCVQLATISSAG